MVIRPEVYCLPKVTPLHFRKLLRDDHATASKNLGKKLGNILCAPSDISQSLAKKFLELRQTLYATSSGNQTRLDRPQTPAKKNQGNSPSSSR